MSQNRVRSRGRTSCCSHAKISQPPPPPPSFKPPPLPDEEDSIFIRPITRTRSPNPDAAASDMPRYLSAQSGSSSRSLSPVYKISHDSFIDGKKLSQAAGEERIGKSVEEELEDENNSKNGHQESSKLSKDFKETEKDVIQSVEEKKEHLKRNVHQSSNHSKENSKHVPKPSSKSLAKPSENENRVEVAEETFVKTTNKTKKHLNKSTSEGTKQDVMLDNGVQDSKPPKHGEDKRVEVVEEPFIEEFAYKTTKQTKTVKSNPTERNNTQSLNNMSPNDSRVEVVKEPIVQEVDYKTTRQNKASELKPAERNNIDSSNDILPNENRVEVVEEPFVEEFAYKTTNLETSPIETSNEIAKSTSQKSEKITSISEKVNPLTIQPVVVPEMTIVPATPPVIHDESKVIKDNLENSDNEEGYPTEIFPPQVEKQLKKKKKKKQVEVRRVKKEKPGELDDKGWPKQTQTSVATNEDIPASRSGSVSSVIKESEAGKNKAVVSTNNLDNKHPESSCSGKTKEPVAKSSQDAHHQDNKLEENRHAGQLNINCESISAKKNDTDIINGNLIEKTPQEKHDELITHEQIDIAGPTANKRVTESKENRIEVIEEPFVETLAYTTTSNGFGEQRKGMLEEPYNETPTHKTTGQRVEIVEEPFVESFAYTTTSDQIAKEDAIGNAIENVKVPFGKTLTTGDKDAFNDSVLKSDILSEKVKSKALANTIESLPFLKTHDNIADLTVETIQDYFSKQDPVKSEESFYADQNTIIQPLQRQEQSEKKITSKVLSTADSDPKYCKLAENMPTISHGVAKIENKNSIAPPPPPPPSETPKFNKDNHENMTKPPSLSQEDTSQRRQRQKPAYESKKDKQIAQIKEFLKGPDGEANQVKMPQVRLKQAGKDADSSLLTSLAPHLYLGTSRAVLEANLPQHGVTCVVSAGPLKEAARSDGVEVFSVVVADDQDLPNHFTAVADRLEKERVRGGAAVVHSGSDCTHAAMLAMAWMVKHGGKSVEEASQMVKDRRPAARLKNGNFVRLQEWHKGAAGGARGMADVATSWLPLLVYLLVVFVSLKFMLGALIKMAGGDKEPEINTTEMYSYFDVYKWP